MAKKGKVKRRVIVEEAPGALRRARRRILDFARSSAMGAQLYFFAGRLASLALRVAESIEQWSLSAPSDVDLVKNHVFAAVSCLAGLLRSRGIALALVAPGSRGATMALNAAVQLGDTEAEKALYMMAAVMGDKSFDKAKRGEEVVALADALQDLRLHATSADAQRAKAPGASLASSTTAFLTAQRMADSISDSVTKQYALYFAAMPNLCPLGELEALLGSTLSTEAMQRDEAALKHIMLGVDTVLSQEWTAIWGEENADPLQQLQCKRVAAMLAANVPLDVASKAELVYKPGEGWSVEIDGSEGRAMHECTEHHEHHEHMENGEHVDHSKHGEMPVPMVMVPVPGRVRELIDLIGDDAREAKVQANRAAIDGDVDAALALYTLAFTLDGSQGSARRGIEQMLRAKTIAAAPPLPRPQ